MSPASTLVSAGLTPQQAAEVTSWIRELSGHLSPHGYHWRTDPALIACSLVAFDIAANLIMTGHRPVIAEVRSPTRCITPVRYPHIEWGGHVCCTIGDVALDPLAAEPVHRGDYERAGRVFTAPVTLERCVDAAYVQGLLDEGFKPELRPGAPLPGRGPALPGE